jgi:tetratricopeptide (TPR) repeat protein
MMAKHLRRNLWPLLLLVACSILLAVTFPYLASAYHLEAGGRAGSGAGSPEDGRAAIDHLRKAIEWSPSNAQAHRLLSQSYQSQGDWLAAVEAMTEYVKLQPKNQLGYIELAQLYEELAAYLERDGYDSQTAEPQIQKLQELDPGLRAVQAWRQAGLVPGAMLRQGERARKAAAYSEALAWYERAASLDPELGDPWYYIGLLQENQREWEAAVVAYRQAIELGVFQQVAGSIPYYRLGTVYQRHLEPPRLDEAQAAYESALAVGEFRSARDMAWTHARLGQVHYQRFADIERAEAEIKMGIKVAPDEKWLHVFLGDLYHLEGRVTEARRAYEQALEIDPSFHEAQERTELLSEDDS